MKISTSTGDFSGYARSVADKVRLFRGSKFKYINLEQSSSDVYFAEGDEYKKYAEELALARDFAGVEYVISHAPCLNAFEELTEEHYATTLRAIERSIEICGILGIGDLVVHASTNPAFSKEEFFKENKRFYTDLLPTMERFGVRVMIENMHDVPFYTFSTGAEMREFLDEVDHPLLGACFDTAHCNLHERARGIGQYKNIVDIGEKLFGLHISDNLGGTNHHHSWPFAGIINFDEVMQGLIDVGFKGYFNFEASYTLLHSSNPPKYRRPWVRGEETVRRLQNPSVELKFKAVDLLYDIGKYMLDEYGIFEE